MSQVLVLENKLGNVVRTLPWEDDGQLQLVFRNDNSRFEILESTEHLDVEGVEYQILGTLDRKQLGEGPYQLPGGSRLRLVTDLTHIDRNEPEPDADNKTWYQSLVLIAFAIGLFCAFVLSLPSQSPELEEELKEHVAKVVKKAPPPQPVQVQTGRFAKAPPTDRAVKPNQKKSVSRMGALGVLGSLSKSKQRGGVDLGAAKTTAGPGLGGSEGSGGVQTSLYAKGVVAAPVGAGGNLQGGGGYGTKGKGGGKAGYGKLSMVGSAGDSTIPLGREAVVDGGLDNRSVAQVMMRNKGQVMFCYEQGLQTDPSLQGRVALDFVIGPDGRVSKAGVGSTTLHSASVEACIVRRLKTWKFPLPEGGVSVKVSYPYMLKRKGQG